MPPPALPELETARLALRPRTPADLDAVAALNADPAVMRYIAPLGDSATGRDAVAARSFGHVDKGLGYRSVFAHGGELLGHVGLIPWRAEEGGVELSYRFAARHRARATPSRRLSDWCGTASRACFCRRSSS